MNYKWLFSFIIYLFSIIVTIHIFAQFLQAIGESTCDAIFGLKGIPRSRGGQAIFDAAALSRLALQVKLNLFLY